MNLCFWNTAGKDLSDILVEFVNEKEIDVLLLAESNETNILNFIIKQSKINPSRTFNHVYNSKVHILSVFDKSVFESKNSYSGSSRWHAYVVDIPTLLKFNLICVHFHSKVNWSDDSLALECVNLSRDIEILEKGTGISESVIVGDFNMNPYESGLVAANGLYALPDLGYTINKMKGRKVDGTFYPYFYNPMWNFFGDNKIPYGTHYYREPGHVSREWNIYDQVIYRPSMAKFIDKSKLEIIHNIAGQNLINALNRPDKVFYSDHLPVYFEINI